MKLRTIIRSAAATTALVAFALPAGAQEAVVSACSGVSLPRSAVTDIIRPVVTGAVVPLENGLNGVLGAVDNLPLIGSLPGTVNTNVSGLLDDAASGDPITLSALSTTGTLVGPDDRCISTADGVQLDEEGGIAIGGNQITGLGANGAAAVAGEIGSIALGNDAATTAGAVNAVALGTGATATAANSVALGAGSTTEADLSAGAFQPGGAVIDGAVAAGEVSVGSAGEERRLTNVAAGAAGTDAANVSQVQAVDDRVTDVDDRVTNVTNVVNNVAGDITDLGDRVTNVEGDVTILGDTVTDLGDRVVNVEGDVTVLGDRVTNVEGDVTDLGDRVTSVEGDVTDLGLRVTNVEGDVTILGDRVTNVEGDLTDLGTRVTTVEGDVSVLGNRVTNVEGDITDIRGDVTNLGGRVTTVEGNVTVLGNRVTNVEGDITDIRGDVSDLGTRVTNVEGDVTVLGDRVTNVEGDVTDLGDRVTTVEGDVSVLDNRVTTVEADVDVLDGRVDTIEQLGLRYDSADRTRVTLAGAGGTTITNLRDGTISAASSDAVNGSQLYETNQALAELSRTSVQYDVDANGNPTNTVTMRGGNASQPVRVRNVARGQAATDAANVEQVQEAETNAKNYTDQRLAEIDNNYSDMSTRMDDVEDQARAAAAIGLAAASLRFDDTPGKVSGGIGGGVWRGQSAFAAGVGYTNETGKVRVNATASVADGSVGAGAGMSFTFN